MEMYEMTKEEVENKILNNMRFTTKEEYYWEDNTLMCKRKVPCVNAGKGYLVIDEPIFIQWRGEPVTIIPKGEAIEGGSNNGTL